MQPKDLTVQKNPTSEEIDIFKVPLISIKLKIKNLNYKKLNLS